MTARKAERVVLLAHLRAQRGKEICGRLRREGIVPAVVYGQGESALPIQVSERDLNKVLHTKAGENVLITLQFEGNATKESAVLIKELQHHPVLRQITHVDFHRVSLTKRIVVTVPLTFQGQALGVRQEGGVLEHIRWELEVECLPTEIPSEIQIDVSGLALNQTLHAKDLVLPAGVLLKTDPEQPVVACVTPRVEELPAVPVEGQAPEAAEPEVLKQKRPEEIAAEEEAKAKEKEGKPEEKKQG